MTSRTLILLALGGCTAVTSLAGPRSASTTSDPVPSSSSGAATAPASGDETRPSRYRDEAEARAWEGEYTMPDLAGQTAAEAWRRLRAAGHVAGVSFHAGVRDDFEGGAAVVIDPPTAGERVIRTQRLHVALSAPPTHLVVIPALAGMTVSDALATLNASGIFEVSIGTSTDCRTDRVCAQGEDAGEVIVARTGVDLEIGGPGNPAPASEPALPAGRIDAPAMRELTMPDLTGASMVEAWRALEALGFAGTLQFRATYVEGADLALITEDVGVRLRADSHLLLRLQAPRTRDARLPGVVGKPAADAIAALVGAGIVDITLDRAVNLGAGCKPGVVCKQDPGPGEQDDSVSVVLGARRR